MKTTRVPEILPEINQDLRKLITIYADTLDQVVAYGTHVLRWQFESAGEKDAISDQHVPPVFLFRYALELVDSISILIRNSSVDPAKAILRSLIESVMKLDYMLSDDTESRAMCFLVQDLHERIATREALNPESQRGKQLRSELLKDKFLSNLRFDTPEESIGSVSRLTALLKTDLYKKYNDEFLRAKKKKNRSRPSWYSLFDGPNTLQDLARKTGWGAMYATLYREFSGAVHGSNVILGKLAKGEHPNEAAMTQLRRPNDLYEVYTITLQIVDHLFRITLERYCPDRLSDYDYWLDTEIRPRVPASDPLTVN